MGKEHYEPSLLTRNIIYYCVRLLKMKVLELVAE